MTRFFDSAAPGWDARYASDPQRAAMLERGFRRHGLETVAAATAGPGTYYLARRP